MSLDDSELRSRYPLLHAPDRWEWADLDVQFSTEPPEPTLVTNIHVVAFVDGSRDHVVVCYDPHPHIGWFMPGGTREKDESIETCVDRELAEEAGARRAGELDWLGAHRGRSDRPKPYRPWQPHPHKAWLWCAADVVVDSWPSNPADGEQVVDVRATPVAQARSLLAAQDAWLGELVDFAVELRSVDGRHPG